MDALSDILTYEILDISVQVYALSFICIVGGFIARRLAATLIRRLIGAAESSSVRYDEIILEALLKPVQLAAVTAGIWGAAAVLPLPGEGDFINIDRFVNASLRSVTMILLIWFGMRLVDGLTHHWEDKAEDTESKLDDQIIPIVRSSTKVFLVLIGIILVLQNLGYSVASLIAGLGLGGAAVAFASKDTLSNLFGSIVIFLDRPFQMGDWIEMAGTEGVVEEVGLRTTKVRTFSNSVITIPNMLFTTNTINNWSKMAKRRVKMTVGLTYDSSPDQMREAVAAIKAIIAADDRFYQDFYMVSFDNMGSSSLDIFIYAFCKTTAWAEYMTIKEEFLLSIMVAMDKIGVDFAFPTQSLHIESLPGEPAALTAERPQ